jgi:hypothetical protein
MHRYIVTGSCWRSRRWRGGRAGLHPDAADPGRRLLIRLGSAARIVNQAALAPAASSSGSTIR